MTALIIAGVVAVYGVIGTVSAAYTEVYDDNYGSDHELAVVLTGFFWPIHWIWGQPYRLMVKRLKAKEEQKRLPEAKAIER